MKSLFLTLFLVCTHLCLSAQIQVGQTVIDTNTLVKNLFIPWDMSWGNDNFIWFSERNGKISRLNPENGQVSVILASIPDLWTDSPLPTENMTTGLFSMVLHPDFGTNPEVFLYYTHYPTQPRVKIVKYTYDVAQNKLINPVVLIDNIPGTTVFHNSGRMVISPDKKLILSTGDRSDGSTPQNINSLNGKILRMNLDGSVPTDNPIAGNYVWSTGIRHSQGLVYSPDKTILYSSQHGASTDDEINIIERNRNYGWPDVEGFCNTPSEQTFCTNNNVKEPLKAWTPTIAPCGIDFYNSDMIPSWKNSLLLTTLKERDFRVLKLTTDGLAIANETIYYDYDKGMGRLRDVCVSPEGDIYVCTSNRDDNGTKYNPPAGIPRADDDRIVRIANIAPRTLVATQIVPTEILLNWKDRWNKESGFKVYRSVGVSNNFDLIATLQPNTTEFKDQNIIANQKYFYKIQTFNSTISSEFSNVIEVNSLAPLGLDYIGKNPYKVFPNPTNDVISIEGLDPASVNFIKIYNALGAFVQEKTLLNTNTFEAHVLAKGLYYLVINNSAKVKFIKN
jgi:aldose sugar dehydrogenase